MKKAENDYKRYVDALRNKHSTPLPDGWVIKNAQDHRAAFIRAVVKADPDARRSYRKLAWMVGQSVRSVSKLLERAGLATKPQEETFELSASIPVEEQLQSLRYKGVPKRLTIESVGTNRRVKTEHYEPPSTGRDPDGKQFARLAANALEAGKRVVIDLRVASQQVIVTEAQPERVIRQTVKPKEKAPAPQPRKPVRVTKPKPFIEPRCNPAWLHTQLLLAWRLLTGHEIKDQYTNEELLDSVLKAGRAMQVERRIAAAKRIAPIDQYHAQQRAICLTAIGV